MSTYLSNLGRGGHGGGGGGGGHGGGGGGRRWGGGFRGGWYGGGWGYPYEAQVWDPTYCYDPNGNIVPCPVPVLPVAVPVNGLADINLPVLGKVGLPFMAVAVGVAAYILNKGKK